MRKHFFRSEYNQIIFHDTLEIIDLNETATFIYKTRNHNTADSTVQKYAKEYHLNEQEAKSEVEDLLEQFIELGIEFSVQENEGKKFAPHTPIVHIIENCNSPCIMCDCWKTKVKTFHRASVLNPFHLKMKELGAKGIMISGGEPLLHPELKEILEYLKEIKLPIFLNTNGILLHRHLDWLTQLQIEELVISMDGSDSETYKLIRGTNKFNKVWDNIRDFRNQNPSTRIVLRSTLSKHNVFKLNELIKLAKECGVDHIGFSPLDISSESFSRDNMDNQRSVELSNKLLPSSEQIDLFLKNFVPGNNYYEQLQELEDNHFLAWGPTKIINCLEFYKNILIEQNNNFSEDPCLFPFFSMIVDYNGDLKNCFYSNAFGNIYELEKAQWNFAKQIKRITESEKCKTCRGKIFCDLGLMKEVRYE